MVDKKIGRLILRRKLVAPTPEPAVKATSAWTLHCETCRAQVDFTIRELQTGNQLRQAASCKVCNRTLNVRVIEGRVQDATPTSTSALLTT